MPSGVKMRSCTKSAYLFPLTFSTMAPSRMYPELLYRHRAPGSNCIGSFLNRSMSSVSGMSCRNMFRHFGMSV